MYIMFALNAIVLTCLALWPTGLVFAAPLGYLDEQFSVASEWCIRGINA